MVIRIRLYVVCLIATLCFASWAQAEYSTLVLQTRRKVGWEQRRAKHVSGLLVRELARQSFLIAAREELGIFTLDQTLRENSRRNKSELQLLLTVAPKLDGNCDLKITQIGETDNPEVWSRSIKFRADSENTYVTLIPQFEAFSQGEFVELLQQLGVAKIASNKKSLVGSPNPKDLQEIDQLLQEVDLFSQFLAVRRLHKLILKVGESPELLGLLVNGYANMGLLTECTWSADSRVFRARSLIYAQRLREKYDDYLFSRWHWSYAQAIAGIHFTAIEQLKDPIPEQDEDFQLPSLPAWGDLVSPYCHFDTETLESLADGGNRWARYLRLWALYTSGEERQIDSSAEAILADCPEAFNSYTLLGQGSIGTMHLAGRASIQAMMQSCSMRWSESQDLPAAVRQAALTPPTRKSPLAAWGKVIETLRQEKDQSELSWQMLANLLEDTATMVAAANIQMARSGSQEHSMAPYVDMFWPAIKDHPHAGYFESRRYTTKNEHRQIHEACQSLRFEDPSLWLGDHTYSVWGIKNSKGERVGYDGFYGASRDFTATGIMLANMRQNIPDERREMYARELHKVSPRSPMALIGEINFRRKNAGEVDPDEIVMWKELAGQSAKSWYELGRLYVARQEYEESYDCFQSSFELSPEHSTAREWAWAYEYAKDLEQVVPTLKLYLEEEDFGLGHSNTHYEIARFYLRHEKPEEAKPHALEAAQSWSARGLSIAGIASERLQLTEEADQWFQKLSSSYPSSSGLNWYLWRRRSGNPDITEARELALRQLGAKELQECSSSGWWPLAYYLMESDSKRALKLTKLRIKSEPGLYSESHLLALALEEENESLADQTLARMKKLAKGKDSAEGDWNSQYVEAIDAIVNAKSNDEIPKDFLDELLKDYSATMGWYDASYFFSRILQTKGFVEYALRYRNKATSFNVHDRITWHLASYDASRLKIGADSP